MITRWGRKHAISYCVDRQTDGSGSPAGTVILAQDIAEARLGNSLRLLFLSSHDPDRSCSIARASWSSFEFMRERKARSDPGALLYLDIDRSA